MAKKKSTALVPIGRRESLIQRRNLSPEEITDAAVSTLDRALALRTPDALQVARMLAEINGRPISDRLLILPLPKDDHYGSIIIPEDSRQEQTCGVVVAVGPGRYENGVLVPCEVGLGNFVVFSKYAAREVKLGRITVLQIAEGDVTFAAGKVEQVVEAETQQSA